MIKHERYALGGKALMTAASAALFILMTLYSAEVKKGVSDAVSLCAGVMIPSLFPMLILSSFTAVNGCPVFLQKLAAKPLAVLFGLSPGCLTPLLLGLTGGYPLAAKTASAAVRAGPIGEEDAERLTLFFTSPGIPFAVTVTGRGYFGSAGAGAALYLSCVSADLLCAAAFQLFRRNRPERSPSAPAALPFSEKLVFSVDNAARSMLSVCAWIGAFSALLGLSGAVTGRYAPFISLVSEITSAIGISAKLKDLRLAAFCLSFGGLCLFCQLLPDIRKNRAGAVRYLAVRAITGMLSAALCGIPARFLVPAVPSATQLGSLSLSGNSAAGSAALLFACAVFLKEMTPGRRQKLR